MGTVPPGTQGDALPDSGITTLRALYLNKYRGQETLGCFNGFWKFDKAPIFNSKVTSRPVDSILNDLASSLKKDGFVFLKSAMEASKVLETDL